MADRFKVSLTSMMFKGLTLSSMFKGSRFKVGLGSVQTVPVVQRSNGSNVSEFETGSEEGAESRWVRKLDESGLIDNTFAAAGVKCGETRTRLSSQIKPLRTARRCGKYSFLARQSCNRKPDYLSQRRQGAKERDKCHFGQKEKAILDPSPRFGMTGGARHFAPLRPFDFAQDMLGGRTIRIPTLCRKQG
jgi:hypothetical protein